MKLIALFTLFVSLAVSQGKTSHGEIIKHRKNPHKLNSVPAGSTGTITPPITYSGGAMIAAPTTYFIWYGNWNQANGSDTPAGQQILRDLAYGLNKSPYFQINTTYANASYPISGATAVGRESADAYSQGSRLRDSSVLAIVRHAIAAGMPYDPNGVYFVLSSSDVSERSGFCTQYCGWHFWGSASGGQRLRYSFVGNANRCLSSCASQTVGPNGNAGVDGMASVVAHELEEAVTDADGTAWFDANGAENADKCAWTFGQSRTTLASGAVYNLTLPTAAGTTRNYLVQRNLKHATGGDTCNMDMVKQ